MDNLQSIVEIQHVRVLSILSSSGRPGAIKYLQQNCNLSLIDATEVLTRIIDFNPNELIDDTEEF